MFLKMQDVLTCWHVSQIFNLTAYKSKIVNDYNIFLETH